VRANVESAEHNLTRSIDWEPGKLVVGFDAGTTKSQCESIIASNQCTPDSYTYYIDFSSNTVYTYTISIPPAMTPYEMMGVFNPVPEVEYTYFKSYFSNCWGPIYIYNGM
jgi:hypothetical protein